MAAPNSWNVHESERLRLDGCCAPSWRSSSRGCPMVGTENGDTITTTWCATSNVAALGGNDKVTGHLGPDTIDGGEGVDTLEGGAGDDRLFGAAGDDVLSGSAGDDVLSGGIGVDRLSGGVGADVYELGGRADTISDSGSDSVVRMPAGVEPKDVASTKNGKHLSVTYPGGTLSFENWFSQIDAVKHSENYKASFVFEDGTTWAAPDIDHLVAAA